MSSAEERGFKVGDPCVVTGNHYAFGKGTVVILTENDGTTCPRFENPENGERAFVHLHNLRNLNPTPLTQTIDELVAENVSLMSQMEKLAKRLTRKQEFYRTNAAEIRVRLEGSLEQTLPA
jgi:hypothetical protein